MSAALQLVPTRLTNNEIAAMVSALDSIKTLTDFMIMARPENPSQRLLDTAISRINQTCESLEPIMQKFEE